MAETATPSSPAQPPRSSARLLIDPVFGSYFTGKLLSSVGFWIYSIVAAILTYELSGSAFVVGMVSVAQFGPQLLFAPMGGALADRADRRHLVVAGRSLVATAATAMAVWIFMVGVDGLPGAWPIILAAFVIGLGFALGGPAENALIPALIRVGELTPAIALNTVPPTLARAVGPAVGALVAASLGPAAAFAIAAAANVVFAVLVLRLKITSRAARIVGADLRVRVGLAYLRKDRVSLLLLIGVVAIGVGADPVITLTPALAEGFGGGSTLVGLLASAFGVGAGTAFVGLGLLRRRLGMPRLGTTGLLMLSFGIGCAGVSPTPRFAVVALAVGGFGMTLALTALTTQLQERLPDDLRGRVMALWLVAFVGSRPIAAAIDGAVADATTPMVAFVLVAFIVAVIAWLCRPAALSRPPLLEVPSSG